MMKIRMLSSVAVLFFTAALSGCVSYGNTHALLTPVGAVGYHTFKPEHTNTPKPQDINLREQRPSDRIAATNEQKQPERSGEF